MAVCYTNDMEDLVLLCERIDCGSLYTYLYQKVSLLLENVCDLYTRQLVTEVLQCYCAVHASKHRVK